jgi:hypothetical protein
MLPYNGYSPAQRAAKGRARAKRTEEKGAVRGPCAMCGDSDAKFWLHSEDYGVPYLWDEPAAYVRCDHCHRRLHRRFDRGERRWKTYWLFLDAGWFGREVAPHHLDRAARNPHEPLERRRNNQRAVTDPWWRELTLDPKCITLGCAPKGRR